MRARNKHPRDENSPLFLQSRQGSENQQAIAIDSMAILMDAALLAHEYLPTLGVPKERAFNDYFLERSEGQW